MCFGSFFSVLRLFFLVLRLWGFWLGEGPSRWHQEVLIYESMEKRESARCDHRGVPYSTLQPFTGQYRTGIDVESNFPYCTLASFSVLYVCVFPAPHEFPGLSVLYTTVLCLDSIETDACTVHCSTGNTGPRKRNFQQTKVRPEGVNVTRSLFAFQIHYSILFASAGAALSGGRSARSLFAFQIHYSILFARGSL